MEVGKNKLGSAVEVEGGSKTSSRLRLRVLMTEGRNLEENCRLYVSSMASCNWEVSRELGREGIGQLGIANKGGK